MKISHLILLTILCTPLAALADPATYNRVDLQAEASREIQNDLMQAQLSIDVMDVSAATVASKINTTLNAAMKTAEGYKMVKVSTGWQNTHPVYGRNNKLDGWRGTAQLRLESRDFKKAGDLIGKLQETMRITGISFTVSPEVRKQAENTLMKEAIDAFKARADIVRGSLGGKTVKIVHMNVGTQGYYPPQPMMMARGAMMAEAAVPAQELAGGESRMVVNVNGTIEVQPE